jgi:hypothetical protein
VAVEGRDSMITKQTTSSQKGREEEQEDFYCHELSLVKEGCCAARDAVELDEKAEETTVDPLENDKGVLLKMKACLSL